MRTSHWFLPTLKEVPNDAEVISHQLMLRAGMIRKLGSGLYTWLPTGLKVLRKVEAIVREEMNRSGALELLMPAIQPAELWQETGRWDTFGGLLLTMKDANGRDYCFGPTHEEVICDTMRHELQSYKQLPLNVYQIQTKFRDEIRPRFGVMRAREFIMKDAYSFHLTEECLHRTYEAMYDAYCRIFDRLGLTYRAVEADTGAIGGFASHEFQVLAESGEDLIFYSDSSDYAANIEKATSLIPQKTINTPSDTLQKIPTPAKKTIDEIASFLNIAAKDTVKTLLVKGTKHPAIALIIRGDDTLNVFKAEKHPLVSCPLTLIENDAIEKTFKLPVGYLGPVGLDLPIIVDHHAAVMGPFVCGANEEAMHYQHACWGRDAHYTETFDLRNVKVGDLSPDGKGTLKTCRGIEVGHVFKLGDKYAKLMNVSVLNEQGRLTSLLMGCYGLGISRVVAAAIEQNHDTHGIIWPQSIAPFDAVIIPINAHRNKMVMDKATLLYNAFKEANIDVLLEDRQERPGTLFADHDLIGIPHRFVFSERHLQENRLEYKSRRAKDIQLMSFDEAVSFMKQT